MPSSNEKILMSSEREGDQDLKTMLPQTKETEARADAKKGFSARWTHTINSGFRRPVLLVLHGITGAAVRNPILTVVGLIFFSMGLFVLGLATNFEINVSDEQWAPQDSLPAAHQKYIEATFDKEEMGVVFLFHADGESVVGYDQVARVFEAVDAVRNLAMYDEICSRSDYVDPFTGNVTCEIRGVTRFFNNSIDVFKAMVSTDEEVLQVVGRDRFSDGVPVNEALFFGKPGRDDEGQLISIEAFFVNMIMPANDATQSFETDCVEELHLVRDRFKEESGSLQMEFQAERSFDDELNRALGADFVLLPVVFVVMSLFACCVFSKWDRVRSRALLGFGGVFAVILSILTGYGFMFVCGVPFGSMTPLIPFIIFGIGLDDTFILIGSYDRTESSKEVEERIHDTIEESGLSITLTSLTSTLAFGLGCISSVPAVFWLCLYACTMVVIDYLYQLTFFVACIVLDERRVQNRRMDCCCCCCVVVEEDPNLEVSDYGNEESVSERAMTWYAEKLVQPWIQGAVVLGFIGLTIGGAFSTTKLKQQFDVVEILPDGSFVNDFFDVLELRTVRSGAEPSVYFRNLDQSDPDVRRSMDSFFTDLATSSQYIPDRPFYCWLTAFEEFSGNQTTTDLLFADQVEAFLEISDHAIYERDIVIEEGEVVASRCSIEMRNFSWDDVLEQVDALEEQRDITARHPLNKEGGPRSAFTFEELYNIWEFYRICVDELIFTTAMGVAAVTAVSFLFIPHWSAALFILPLISILYIDLLGFLQFPGNVAVNPVSYITLVLSVGLMVDFLMHILLRYFECKGNRREKTVEALRTMGTSILVGGVSTFLGTVPLFFSQSDIFRTIFFAFLGLVTLGCAHGLILLPVLLSLIGPEDAVEMDLN